MANSNAAPRIKKGFHRIGVALAAVSALVGLIIGGVGLYQWAEPLMMRPRIGGPPVNGWSLAYAFRYGDGPAEIEAFTQGNARLRENAQEFLDGIDRKRRAGSDLMGMSLFAVAIAAALYAACWTLGWIIAAFFGD